MSTPSLRDRTRGAAGPTQTVARPVVGEVVDPRTELVQRRKADVANHQSAIAMALGDPKAAERFVRVAMTALSAPPAYPGASTLADCTRESLLGGLITCAQLRLEPNDPRGLAYLIPFRNNRQNTVEAQLVIGYKGLVDLSYRSNQVKVLRAVEVCEHDTFDVSDWPAKLEHRKFRGGSRGEVVEYYAAVEYVTGGQDFVTMTVAEVESWRERYVKGWKRKDGTPDQNSPWVSNFDEQAKKTCIRRLAKMMPQSIEDLRVGLQVDGAVVQHQATAMLDLQQVAASAHRPEIEAAPEGMPPGVDPQTGEADNSWPAPAPIPNGVQIQDPDLYGGES